LAGLTYRCCICSKRLTGTGWVCHECAAKHGLDVPYADWPDWAKALANSEQAERRYESLSISGCESWPRNPAAPPRRGRVVVSYEEAGCEDLIYGERA
jgi:hypothetical protein